MFGRFAFVPGVAGVDGNDGRPAAIEWQRGQANGTRDRAVNRGPSGTQAWLAGLFTGQSREAEAAAYERLHAGRTMEGREELGVTEIQVPQGVPFRHPDSNVMIEPAEGGRIRILDGEVLADRAAAINEQREYAKRLFSAMFVDDLTLARCTSDAFLRACSAGENGGLGTMPVTLRNAECRPSILNYLSPSMEQFQLGVAKASYLLQYHPHVKGRVITGGMPKTHAKQPRSGKSALEEAVA